MSTQLTIECMTRKFCLTNFFCFSYCVDYINLEILQPTIMMRSGHHNISYSILYAKINVYNL